MKDFRDKRLYEIEQGAFLTFVDNMLETNSEYNQEGRHRTGLIEEEEDDDEFFDSFDSSGMDDFSFDMDFSAGGMMGGASEGGLMNPRGYTEEEMGSALKMMLYAPMYAFNESFTNGLIKSSNLNDATKKRFAKDWRYWGLGVGAFSFVSLLPMFKSFITIPVGMFSIASSVYMDYYVYHKKYEGDSYVNKAIETYMGNDLEEFDKEAGEGLEEDSEDIIKGGLGDFGGFEEEEGFGGGLGDFGGFDGGGFGGFDEEPNSLASRYGEDEYEEEEEEDDYYDPEAETNGALKYFPHTDIQTDTTEMFREGLLRKFQEGVNTKGNVLKDREEMVKYYSRYLPNNDDGFSKWTVIQERNAEYENIAYTIYKALVAVNGRFDMKTAVPEGEKMTIMDIRRTPLIYRITVKLPSYFRINTLTNQTAIFNDMLKASDDDVKVGTILTSYGGDLVIKFLRLDYNKLVSMGDLLRLDTGDNTESFAEQFATSSGVPMVAGMRDNEYPYMVDIVGNPAAAIVGGSGSGKSWLTFQFMDSMLMSNSPEHVNFLILDAKDAAIWKQFALAPHVIGYHSDFTKFIEILEEVTAEHARRMAKLSELGIESWKDYNSRYKRRGEWDKVADMPLLFVIVDEITFSMSELREIDEDAYKRLKGLLTSLSSVIRASGIRLMLIGQRAIDTSIPKSFMANAPLKLAMKMNTESDFTVMLGKGYDRKVSRIPSGPGEGIMIEEGESNPSYVKTVIPGGTSDEDILMQVRVMALDWVRRADGSDYDYTTNFTGLRGTITKGFNRDKNYSRAIQDIKEGRISDPVTPDESYLIHTNSPNANLMDNALENIGRKLDKREGIVNEEVFEEVDSLEEDFGTEEMLDEFDWDVIMEDSEEEGAEDLNKKDDSELDFEEFDMGEYEVEDMHGEENEDVEISLNELLKEEKEVELAKEEDIVNMLNKAQEKDVVVKETDESLEIKMLREEMNNMRLEQERMMKELFESQKIINNKEDTELKHQEEMKQHEELKHQEEMKQHEELKHQEEMKQHEELKRQEELRQQEELKRQEELRQQEELKRQEELRQQEEIKRQEELRQQEEIKRQEELKRKKGLKNKGKEPSLESIQRKHSGVVQRNSSSRVNVEKESDMSVGSYIAQYGEEVAGQRRVDSELINAKFNRRKLQVALLVGEVYEEGGYYYFTG